MNLKDKNMAKKDQTFIADEASAGIKEMLRGISPWVTVKNIECLLGDIEPLFETMKHNMQKEALSQFERFRLLGAGTKRYGFIDLVSDIAEVNPRFAPQFYSNYVLKDRLRQIEMLRNMSVMLQTMLRINDDVLLQVSDDAFQMALIYYNSVRESSRRNRTGAQALFKQMQSFFSRKPRKKAAPTVKETERDARALLHGQKDGTIIIENERPHMVGGQHIVVDETDNG